MQNAMHSYHHDICYAVQANGGGKCKMMVEREALSLFLLVVQLAPVALKV